MLNNAKAMANVPVKDMTVVRKFYEDKLGFRQVDKEGDEVVVYESGEPRFLVYHSHFAGTNKATSMTFVVGDEIEKIARDLKSKDVPFEHYDMPDLELNGDVYSNDHMKVAWFKDPDGNFSIL